VAELIIYDTTSLSDSDVALMFNKFAQQNIARAGSASFGLCETFAFLDGSMWLTTRCFWKLRRKARRCLLRQGIALRMPGCRLWQTVCHFPERPEWCCTRRLRPMWLAWRHHLDYTPDTTTSQRSGWDAGGGGVSAWESSPSWQQPVLPLTAAGKAVPDVSMDADIVSGAIIYAGCQPDRNPRTTCQFTTGGTSLSSPYGSVFGQTAKRPCE